MVYGSVSLCASRLANPAGTGLQGGLNCRGVLEKGNLQDQTATGSAMRQLIHRGVMMPKPYEARGLHISIRGKRVKLTPVQEEMAVAYAKKMGTEYVKDPVFVRNFFTDFSKALGLGEPLDQDEVDLSEVIAAVEHEKEVKLRMSKEEKKRQAEARKALRAANKEQYGYAIVDGERVEIGNYTAEPSCIFMG
ncbi:MAG: hypothetical protein QXT81_05120, partial [Candidatus Bathyarchaeia archaeon]